MHKQTGSDQLLSQFSQLFPRKIDLSLDRIKGLLDKLGRPHDNFPFVIHVAGTNGKGSVIAYLQAILVAAGYRVHSYTSPHLVHFHERIKLSAGPGRVPQPISEPRLVEVFEACRDANGDAPITFFEVTTVAAFVAFSQEPADFILLETGLGGRYDATNVIERPGLSVITRVDIDHTEFLGHDVLGIAREKAGIFKPNCPAVCSPQVKSVLDVLCEEAERLGAPLLRGGIDFISSAEGSRIKFAQGPEELTFNSPSLLGDHQIENAGTAIACARIISSVQPIDEQHIQDGLVLAKWPGRLQKLNLQLDNELPSQSVEVWLDGGHNASAGQAISAAMAEMPIARQPLRLIIGMLAHKDLEGFLKPFRGLVEKIIFVPLKGSEAYLPTDEAIRRAAKLGFECRSAQNYADALQQFYQSMSNTSATQYSTADEAVQIESRILICGSLYLAGEVLEDLESAV